MNHGRGGALAWQMLKRIRQTVERDKPTLVIWQTGVNDAIRKVDIEKFRRQVVMGVTLLQKRGIDVVLLDPQYFPRSEKLPHYRLYLNAMREVAAEKSVPILHRYQFMKYLVTTAHFDIKDLLAKDRFHLNDLSYKCLANALADGLAGSIKRPRG